MTTKKKPKKQAQPHVAVVKVMTEPQLRDYRAALVMDREPLMDGVIFCNGRIAAIDRELKHRRGEK